MVRYTVQEAQAALETLLDKIQSGEPVEIIRGNQVIALYTVPQFGCMKHRTHIHGDLVEPLDVPWDAQS